VVEPHNLTSGPAEKDAEEQKVKEEVLNVTNVVSEQDIDIKLIIKKNIIV
jgi:hypothetical protein